MWVQRRLMAKKEITASAATIYFKSACATTGPIPVVLKQEMGIIPFAKGVGVRWFH